MSFAKFKAPTEDGAWLAHPDPGAWRRLLEHNREIFQTSNALIGGLPWKAWRDLVRSEVGVACGSGFGFGDTPLVVSAHQPELFHVGVWIKNFAAAGLAKAAGGKAVHVVADADVIKRTTVAVPAGTLEAPLVAHLPFDRWTGEVPFEDREVEDEEMLARFGVEAKRYLSALPYNTIFTRFWDYVLDLSKRDDMPTSLVHRFSVARYFMEFCPAVNDTTEGRLSRFCKMPCRGFLHLAAEVMLRAEEYRSIYNEELLAYRRRQKIRGTHHPASELAATDDGIEVPFWMWKVGERRARPFVKHDGERLILSINGVVILEAAIPSTDDRFERLADELLKLQEWKLRPRALMTTTFLRLGLADLFIHGLGGAKYDEWNDAVMRRFWNIEPPAYVMLTATRKLPLGDWKKDPRADVRALKQRLRSLEWNPERHLDDMLLERAPICDWVEEKASLAEALPTSKKGRRERWRRFRELNERLREFVSGPIDETREGLREAEERVAAYDLMGAREFFFAFHPAQSLRPLFSRWLDWSQPPAASGSVGPSSL